MRLKNTPQRRRAKGSTIAEMGLALYVLLFGFSFPMIALLGIPMGYSSLMLLNGLQTCEAARLPYQQAEDPSGIVMSTLPQKWLALGIAKFINVRSGPVTTVSYQAGVGPDKIVTVNTTTSLNPWLTVPFIANVPGLTAPMTFQFSTSQVVEDPEFAP